MRLLVWLRGGGGQGLFLGLGPGLGSGLCCSSRPQVIQVPQGKYKVLPTERTKVSSYPVALIPGQFQEYYKRWAVVPDRVHGMLGDRRPLAAPARLALTSHALSQVRVRALTPGSGGNSLRPGFAFRRSICSCALPALWAGSPERVHAPQHCSHEQVRGRQARAQPRPGAPLPAASGPRADKVGEARGWPAQGKRGGDAPAAATPLPWPLSTASPSLPGCDQDQH